MAKQGEIKDCEKLVKGVCLMGYQACALTMWHPNCKNRRTQQPDKVTFSGVRGGMVKDIVILVFFVLNIPLLVRLYFKLANLVVER